MSFRKLGSLALLFVVLSMLVAACGGAATPAAATEAPQETEAAAVEPAAPSTEAPAATEQVAPANAPTELNIAAIFITPLEETWAMSFYQSMQRVMEAKPHGVKINMDYTENVYGDDAERVIREYAKTGKYQIIWATSGFSDQVKKVKDDFPEILFVVSGSGNEGLGGNVYWTYTHIHEPAFLMGMVAGLMTKSNVIGIVASYPYDDINDGLNGYIDGAKAVNPNIKVKVTFIESWYDPAKAKEAAYAQIAAGADYIYAERFGPFEACKEKGVHAFGQYLDQYDLSPEVVATSTLALWEPQINYIIDQWWAHVTEGKAYDGPKEPVWFTMAQGSGDIAPYHDFEALMPDDVKAKVAQARQDILDGKLQVELKLDPPTSD
jgi:basic membrane lipoprotein Med (substrate-binding protein (PBP1-ABC) superfamily)